MTDTVVIALSRFSREAERIALALHGEYREYTPEVFAEVFPHVRRIVAVMSAGIVVRQIAPLLRDKWIDPSVVVVSPDFRYAIPVIGGHHGANALAQELSGLGIVPVITTATETMGKTSVESIADTQGCTVVNRDSTRAVNAAVLDGTVNVHAVRGPAVVIAGPAVSVLIRDGKYAIGIGCRRGTGKDEVTAAVRAACAAAGIDIQDVQVYATTAKKFNETGLVDAIFALSANLIFLDDDTINAQAAVSPSKAKRLGLSGVAEPCALAVAQHKELVMKKNVYGRVTVAIAR